MSHLNYGVRQTSYYYTELGAFLEEDNYKINGNNIGYKGENLTITFLSLNRADLSIRLLNSIAKHLTDFRGEVLVIDNGSDTHELTKLEDHCSNSPFKCRIERLGANYGVAGGRNRTMAFVRTEWVLFLDNDIYFLNDPLPTICKDISLLGCHFINLPLLDPDQSRIFSLGGHLYVDSTKGEINVGGGSCYRQNNYEEYFDTMGQPFISNFLFGGASIHKKETFLKLGGYDEFMFIGFEDTDLSIRIFREGYKIGNSCVMSLVHDHPKPIQEADLNYEKKRFSVNTIKKSAEHLEEKYGYKIWDANLVKWLEEKNNILGNNITPEVEILFEQGKNNKPQIALITDVDYWAFGNIARQIEKNLSHKYDIHLISFEDCNWDPIKLLFRTSECEILHFFWREMIPVFTNKETYTDYLNGLDVSPEEFIHNYLTSKILSTSVYDHLFLSGSEIESRNSVFSQFNYYVSSNKLMNIYTSIKCYPNPMMVIEDGIDDSLFYPLEMNRFENLTRPLVIGWVGNSKWAEEAIDFKGFNTIVKPLIEEMKVEGYNVTNCYCDRVDGFVPHDEMLHYYKKIDVLVCMSLIEGTPNPVLEAMACGVPVISTDVGIVPQVLGPRQKEFIIERTKENLKNRIIDLIENRTKLRLLSNENLEYIQSWRWSVQCGKFETYFDQLLQNTE